MIYESWYWKRDLLKISARLTKMSLQSTWNCRSFYILEKDLFIAFFSIRKLLEPRTKISTKASNSTISAIKFPIKQSKSVNKLNSIDIYKTYDMDFGRAEDLRIKDVCNFVIHSYVYEPFFDEATDKLIGIHISSDKTKNKYLYYFEMASIIDMIDLIANDNVCKIECNYSKDTLDYSIEAS